ncbi:hypothetical protein ALP29_201265 [Pseudomonas syringae pv. avii]|uniref:Uncharacterized protein n=1 Tax=Pseudomonas syringae pv. avii TaxID=663959 RepID=A0A3M5V7A2_PSESX|nr:hypothetical protein ALP29_201265 [Pseudomonas syringae pv. avii]
MNQLADANDAVEGEDVICLEQLRFHLVGLIHRLVGVVAHLTAAGLANIDGFGHVRERLAVFTSGLDLTIK